MNKNYNMMEKFQCNHSDNILKLRTLTEKICKVTPIKSNELIEEIRTIIHNGSEEIMSLKTPKQKLTHYEVMFSKIYNILE
jgi:uncharacterized membrane protein